MRCLAKRPADRWQTADELVDAARAAAHAQRRDHPDADPADDDARSSARPTGAAGRCSEPCSCAGGRAASCAAGARRHPGLGKRAAVTLEPGLEHNAALSPDGKLVAYSRITPAESRLVVQQLAGGEPVTVARWPGLVTAMPAWSPDGARLTYRSPRGLEVVPALGGVSRLLSRSADSGQVGRVGARPERDRLHQRRHALRPGPAPTRRASSAQQPSPLAGLVARWEVDRLRVGEPPVPTYRQPRTQLDLGNAGGRWHADPDHRGSPAPHQPGVAADSRGLLYVSDQDGGQDVYFVGLARSGAPEGAPVRVTTGLHPHTISLSADGSTLVYGLTPRRPTSSSSGSSPTAGVAPGRASRSPAGRSSSSRSRCRPTGAGWSSTPTATATRTSGGCPWTASAPPEPISTGPEDEFQGNTRRTENGCVPRDPERIGARSLRHARGGRAQTDPGADGQQSLTRYHRMAGPCSIRCGARPGSSRCRPRGERRATRDGPGRPGRSRFRQPDRLGGMVARRPLAVGRGTRGAPRRTGWTEPASHRHDPAGLHSVLDPMVGGRSGSVLLRHLDRRGLPYLPGPRGRGPRREAARSEGPTYQTFRFVFEVHGGTLYFALVDRQSDIWQADVLLR